MASTKSLPPAAKFLLRWHKMLGLPQQPRPWYRDRLREELGERHAAITAAAADAKKKKNKNKMRNCCLQLSETADVFYIISRSHHDGYPLRAMPSFLVRHVAVYGYMIWKYTSRWWFYRTAEFICRRNMHFHSRTKGGGGGTAVREVVNPERDGKLLEVAERNGIDSTTFLSVCRRLRRAWPLLP